MEISDICMKLTKMAGSGILDENSSRACVQAVNLLSQFRQITLSDNSPETVACLLKAILAEQGEG